MHVFRCDEVDFQPVPQPETVHDVGKPLLQVRCQKRVNAKSNRTRFARLPQLLEFLVETLDQLLGRHIFRLRRHLSNNYLFLCGGCLFGLACCLVGRDAWAQPLSRDLDQPKVAHREDFCHRPILPEFFLEPVDDLVPILVLT